MKELVDMLLTMTHMCKDAVKRNPEGYAQALQYVQKGSLPGIRAGLGNGVMIRVVIEKENNDANREPTAAEAHAWNSLWVDPSREREAE